MVMGSKTAILFICLAAICCPLIAQEKEAERKGLKIDDALFENTMLNPDRFRMILEGAIKDSGKLEETIFKAIEFAIRSNSKSSYYHEFVRVGESVSFELRGNLFIVRVLTKAELQQVSDMAPDDLPSDLKSKQMFKVTSVSNGAIFVERGATKIAIPTDRILYFQRGLAAFFK